MMSELVNLTRRPLVVILGATGTGKSKLAISLASRFKGEVISADSMQVYKGLDILTNKVTIDEMKGIPHHLLSFVDPKEKYSVSHFKKDALPIMENIFENNKLPIIVGGTNYYIESMLWNILIDKMNDLQVEHLEDSQEKDGLIIDNNMEQYKDNPVLEFIICSGRMSNVEENELTQWSNKDLYDALKLIDMERAARLHPNDRRKIIRSIQVRFQTGKKHSELLKLQNSMSSETDSNTHLGGPLRFPNCICLWIQAEKEILNKRIESRVDEMVEKGLRQEIHNFFSAIQENNCDINFQEGILQSIGFKEFMTYLQLPELERSSEEGEKYFQLGLDQLKLVTKQYSTKQVKWIKQRFLRPSRRQVPPVYQLNGNLTEDSEWDKNVTQVAYEIVQSHLLNQMDNSILKEHLVPQLDDIHKDLISRTCDICERVFIGNVQWDDHMKSIRHRKMIKRRRQLEYKKNEKDCATTNNDDNESSDKEEHSSAKISKISS